MNDKFYCRPNLRHYYPMLIHSELHSSLFFFFNNRRIEYIIRNELTSNANDKSKCQEKEQMLPVRHGRLVCSRSPLFNTRAISRANFLPRCCVNTRKLRIRASYWLPTWTSSLFLYATGEKPKRLQRAGGRATMVFPFPLKCKTSLAAILKYRCRHQSLVKSKQQTTKQVEND